MKPSDELIERNIKYGMKEGLGLNEESGDVGLLSVVERAKRAYGREFSEDELEELAHEAVTEAFEDVEVE